MSGGAGAELAPRDGLAAFGGGARGGSPTVASVDGVQLAEFATPVREAP